MDMKFNAIVLGVLAAALMGCAAVEQKVEQVQQDAEQAVTAKVNEATAAAQQKANAAAEQAKQDILKQVDPQGTMQNAAAKVQEAQTMLGKIEKGQVFDPAVQKWIETTMADASQAVRATAIPVMNAAYEKFPEKRKWLEGEVNQAMKGADGAVRTAWQDVLDAWTRVQAVAETQR